MVPDQKNTPQSNGAVAEAAAPAPKSHDPAPVDEHGIPKDLKRPHPVTIIAMLLLFCLVLAGLFYIGYKPHEKAAEQARADASELANALPVVSIARPQPSKSVKDLTWPCDVRANQETAVYTRANGFLSRLYVDIGSHVKAGDLLAEIDSPDVDAQLTQSEAALKQAQASVSKANADLTLARQTLKRYQDLQRSGNNTVTQQEVDEKTAALDQSRAELELANANVAAADATLKRFTAMKEFERITAPFEGVITARNYDVGALLSPTDTGPNKQIFNIAQTDPVRVFVSVPQVYATAIKNEEPAYLDVRNYPAREFKGAVVLRSDAIDLATRVMRFEVHFPNHDGALVPGMYANLRVGVEQQHPVMTIPTSALVFDASGTRVAKVEDGKIHFQPVKVGQDRGMTMEITDGLSPSDVIVAAPGEQLMEGGEVRVANPQDATVNTLLPTTAPVAEANK
ncbi:MAG TPA: efflux RND transporter periplasmic adaptor subunit [Phycisphaerae bacterium]|nr:efflux RND transporter periplasmic adaptor subunit [Phycisphaerae bacterium]